MTAVELAERARRFLGEDLWKAEGGLRSFSAAAIGALQMCVMIGQRFYRDQLLMRASALTYMTTLAVIPLLAVALTIVKALGVSENLAEFAVGQIAAGSPEARERILAMLSDVNIGGLGTMGAAVLLVTSVLALRHLESTLNDIWGVRSTRGWMRRFADYLAVLIVAPLLMGVAMSLATTLQSEPIVQQLLAFPGFARLYDLGLSQAPKIVYVVAFTFLYWFFPSTNVRVSSALLGGIVAALLFALAQFVYLDFSIGAARYNALFGGFAALPLLLVWVYLAWSIVLLGSEVSFAVQNLARYRREARGALRGAAERELATVSIATEIARVFRDRLTPWTVEDLATRTGVDMRSITLILEQLEAVGIVSPLRVSDKQGAYQLGRPAEDVRIADLLMAVRGERGVLDSDDDVGRSVAGLFADIDQSVARVADAQTLADLLERIPSEGAAPGR